MRRADAQAYVRGWEVATSDRMKGTATLCPYQTPTMRKFWKEGYDDCNKHQTKQAEADEMVNELSRRRSLTL